MVELQFTANNIMLTKTTLNLRAYKTHALFVPY